MFYEFNMADFRDSDRKVLINLSFVTSIDTDCEGRTTLRMVNGNQVVVSTSYSQVKDLITQLRMLGI